MRFTAIRGKALLLPGHPIFGGVETTVYFHFFTVKTEEIGAAEQLNSLLSDAHLKPIALAG